MKIIVLSITPYKEKDGIVNAISENESLTFLARGIKDPKSKNAALNNVLTVADIELMDGNFTHPILKSSKPLFSPLKVDMDAKYLASLMTIDEMMLNLFPEEEKQTMFPYLEKAVENLKNTNDWLVTLLQFMAHDVRIGGFQLEVNRCVLCGRTNNIVTFSFNDGGFICEDCYQPEMERDMSKEQMILLRKIVNCPDFHLKSSDYKTEDLLLLFDKFTHYIEEAFGYHFKNMRLLIDSK